MNFLKNFLGIGDIVTDLGDAVKGTTEVFRVNETEKMHAQAAKYQAALAQHTSEFSYQRQDYFGRVVDALNRLPRPMMALGTIGLFAFAMIKPDMFSERMVGMALVPEPLWWLLGAVVSFYFGARELHHFRINPAQQLYGKYQNDKTNTRIKDRGATIRRKPKIRNSKAESTGNPAIDEWLQQG